MIISLNKMSISNSGFEKLCTIVQRFIQIQYNLCKKKGGHFIIYTKCLPFSFHILKDTKVFHGEKVLVTQDCRIDRLNFNMRWFTYSRIILESVVFKTRYHEISSGAGILFFIPF